MLPPSFRGICTEKDPVWVTKDKQVILIRNMTDKHLMNTIFMLRRMAETIKSSQLFSAWDVYAGLSGEMATYAMEGEINFIETSNNEDFLIANVESYKYLIAEAKKRKLI